jgi:phosphotransferase system enzyme I (PtsI)
MTLALTGHAIGNGIAIGRAHLAERNELEIGEYRIDPVSVDKEIQRFRAALTAAHDQLDSLFEQISGHFDGPAGEIIQTHVLMLGDSSIRQATETRIREEYCNAEWALQSQLESILSEFRHMDDDYIRSRSEDVVQVVRLVQRKLGEADLTQPFDNTPDRLAETLVVASELTPGELAILHKRGVAGVITEHGSQYSHTAILAGSLGIPAIMGVRLAQSLLNEGEILVLDGGLGVIYANPEKAVLEHFEKLRRETVRFRQSLEEVRERPSQSLDGEQIQLLANAERGDEIQLALEHGAEGIGLFRTEFLYLRGEAPDEDTQLRAYREALEMLDGQPLTVRTLDLGAEKTSDSLDFKQLRSSANPALGLRAIRLCLRDTALFKTQLRAILRASAHGPMRCLIPMLTSKHEVLMVRATLDQARAELDERGQAYDPELPLGGMIEVPAAAMAIADIGQKLDFLSVGTNDLLQYALAADRVDEQVAHLYDPQHPGVVMLLQHVFNAARDARIPISVCGEMAGDPRYTRLLLALGLRAFSMHPSRLLEVKQAITQTDIALARAALTQWENSMGREQDASLLNLLDQSQHSA